MLLECEIKLKRGLLYCQVTITIYTCREGEEKSEGKFVESKREKGIANERYFLWGETTVHIALIFLRGNPSHTSSLREKIANYRIIGRV